MLSRHSAGHVDLELAGEVWRAVDASVVER